jgi:predicted esterase
MPIILRHGSADGIVHVSHSRKLAEALRERGVAFLYDEIPGGDHAAPSVDTPWEAYLDFVLNQ